MEKQYEEIFNEMADDYVAKMVSSDEYTRVPSFELVKKAYVEGTKAGCIFMVFLEEKQQKEKKTE